MMVAKWAAFGALALAGLGFFVAAKDGDVILAASSISALLVAALFWTLAEIGERIGSRPVASEIPAQDLVPVTEAFTVSATPTATSTTGSHDLAELERKLAAKRSH